MFTVAGGSDIVVALALSLEISFPTARLFGSTVVTGQLPVGLIDQS